MRNFTKKGSWLDQTSLEIRVIYTLFILFALVGHLSFILISVYRIGPGVSDIMRHYRGDEGGVGGIHRPAVPEAPAGAAPLAGAEMAFPKEFMELLEVTHFHAYIEGILLLVLAHLFAAVPLSTRARMTVIVIAFGSTFLDLISPWLIRYGTGGFAYLQIAAWIGMILSSIPLLFLPLWAMWREEK